MKKPTESTVRKLYALSMNLCAYPDCPTKLVTPETGTIIGEVCHIRAQNVGGPRYLATQGERQRHGFDNLILMCRNHHKEIDTVANLERYTVEWLREAKRTHETKAREAGEIEAPEEVIVALTWSATIYESGATHMDFRGAKFDLGGKGGGPSGGGGAGGMLTIVGLASVPPEMTVDLTGQDGQDYGGGGGGGGAVNFVGRPVTSEDIEDGLKVPLLLPVNSSHVAHGLLFILGAGWEYYPVDQLPCQAMISVVVMAEFGSINPNVLLGFELALEDPSGTEQSVGTVDIEVPKPSGSINRMSRNAVTTAELKQIGVHTLSVRSGGAIFAKYTFEVRLR